MRRLMLPVLPFQRFRTCWLWPPMLICLLLGACTARSAEVPVIKIGLVAPFEGSFRDVGNDAIYAARLAVREINRAGGSGGLRIELVAYDDRGEPEIAVRAARSLVTDPDVVAVIGHYRPETTDAASPIYVAAGVPLITLGGWGTQAETVWRLMPSPAALTATMQALAADNAGASTVWEGASVVAPPTGADPADAAAVLSTLPPAAAGSTLLAWRDAGWTGQVIGDWNLSSFAFQTIAGPAATGALFVTPYPYPADVPDTAQWAAAYQTMGPHVPAPGPYALPTYEALYTLAEAVAVQGEGSEEMAATREALAASLERVSRVGLLGAIAWDDQHDWRAAPLYVYRWEPQAPKLVDTLTP